MVMIIPTTRLMRAMNHSFRERVIAEPTSLPIGVIARSVPSVNSPMPKISIIAPIIKEIRMSVGTGTTVKHSTNTMAVIGRTEESDSFSFS